MLTNDLRPVQIFYLINLYQTEKLTVIEQLPFVKFPAPDHVDLEEC